MRSLSGADLEKPVHQALQQIGKQSNPSSILARLLLYEQICAQPGRTGRVYSPSVRLFLRRTLRNFRRERPQEAALLAQRFVDGETVKEIAHARQVSQETINRGQRLALQLFAEWLSEQERAAWAATQHALLASLPPKSFARLFGQRSERTRLAGLLSPARAPWVIAVSGIGGIGKTSLVNLAARQLAASLRYRRILWLQAADGARLDERSLLDGLARRLLPIGLPASRHQAALHQQLAATPSLIVLDNLDDEAQDPRWVDWLQSFANPSKFILCSRSEPAALARAYRLQLGELDLKTAAQLLRHQAGELGLERAQSALQKAAPQIYARTGGNPLALKLVVGLMFSLPLGQILDSLQDWRGGDIHALYQRIYSLSWDSLAQPAKQALLSMLLVAESGASWAQLKAASQLSEADLHDAVMQLRGRSLLEVSAAGSQPRYAIHQLTRTFLRKELLNEG